jgi:hypothetical protein
MQALAEDGKDACNLEGLESQPNKRKDGQCATERVTQRRGLLLPAITQMTMKNTNRGHMVAVLQTLSVTSQGVGPQVTIYSSSLAAGV